MTHTFRRATLREIISTVCIEADISFGDLCTDRRSHRHLRARQAIAVIAHEGERTYSFPEIGRAIGRAHSVVRDSCLRGTARLGTDPQFRDLINRTNDRLDEITRLTAA